MVVGDVQRILEAWAPVKLAWERDNVGLLIGSSSRKVAKILVSLDVTDEVIAEAIKKKIDLLVTHHPLIFGSVRTITDGDRTGKLILSLVRQNIALYAAHTNLDFTRSGVSFALAERLNLLNARVLAQDVKQLRKVVVFVPATHAEKVTHAMTEAGAGAMGNYDSCTFQAPGTGTFRPQKGANPFIGSKGTLERVDEIRLETIVPAWNLNTVLAAMLKSHPYETVAYDVYALENTTPEYGAGVIGELRTPMTLRVFLKLIRSRLGTPSPRYAGNLDRQVRIVAACGGSGSDLLPVAIMQGADVFVTADVKYHTFQSAEASIALVDAGHYETEAPIVKKIVSYLSDQCRERKERITVLSATRSHNPVQYFMS